MENWNEKTSVKKSLQETQKVAPRGVKVRAKKSLMASKSVGVKP